MGKASEKKESLRKKKSPLDKRENFQKCIAGCESGSLLKGSGSCNQEKDSAGRQRKAGHGRFQAREENLPKDKLGKRR